MYRNLFILPYVPAGPHEWYTYPISGPAKGGCRPCDWVDTCEYRDHSSCPPQPPLGMGYPPQSYLTCHHTEMCDRLGFQPILPEQHVYQNQNCPRNKVLEGTRQMGSCPSQGYKRQKVSHPYLPYDSEHPDQGWCMANSPEEFAYRSHTYGAQELSFSDHYPAVLPQAYGANRNSYMLPPFSVECHTTPYLA